MKNKLLMVLLFAVLLAVYCLWGLDYMKQRQQQESLSYQIADSTLALAQMPQPAEGLEQRLATAQANLAAAESDFPAQVNSTLAIKAILNLADDIGVKAIPLVTQPWSVEKNGEHNYYVLRLNVSALGSFSSLTKFTEGLENGEFPTLIIENLTASRDAESSEEGISESVMPVSVSLDLAIYTRSPPDD
jgi:hypothetical protein